MAEEAENAGGPWIHIRREPFEFGLLPIPSLMHKEGAVEALKLLRSRLLESSPSSSDSMENLAEPRITSEAIATCLSLPEEQARLVLDTLASILPTDNDDVDPLSEALTSDIESVGADVDHLLLFLFIQSYKRVPHRSHRDAAALADVWPQGPSPFDSISPSTSSALQMKTSLATRQKFQPGQAEEEAHQLVFVQKHLGSMLSLLAELSTEDSGKVIETISIDKFELLGLLLRVGRIGTAALLLSQVAPFFANSDPTMPPSPVPISTVQEWLSSRICSTSDHCPDLPPVSPGDRLLNSPPQHGGSLVAGAVANPGANAMVDVNMSDAGVVDPTGAPFVNGVLPGQQKRAAPYVAGLTSIDGVAKMSVLKGENEVENGFVRVAHCHDSVIYVLSPLKYATIVGCSDSIVVLGAVGRGVKVELCERMQLIVPCSRIKISNCRECLFYLGTNSRPVIIGDNHNLQVAPYNTFYPRLDYHLAKVRVDPSTNKWDAPLTLGSADPHEVGPSPAGANETPSERALLLPPDRFVPFVVPFRSMAEQQGSSPLLQQQTRANPFALPKAYLLALQQKTKTVENLRQTLKNAVLEENRKRELTNVIQAHFKEWLLTSGNIRQVYDLARLDRDP